MRTIIAFDPGLTCGVAIFHDGTLWDAHALTQDLHYNFLTHLFPAVATNPETVVLCEDYIGRYLTTEAKITLKLIGMIELATRRHLGHLPVYQRAQTRLSFLPQARMLVRQLPVQQKWLPHHYDAVAQGLAYLYYSKDDTAVLAPDLCYPQGAADEPPTAREA